MLTHKGFIFFIPLSLEPSLQIEKGLFCIYLTKLSCNAGPMALFKIAVVLVREHLNFLFIFESENILLYIEARWSAVRKERLSCTIKLVCITSALITESLTSSDAVLVKNLCTLRVFLTDFSIVLWSSAVLLYISKTHMMACNVSFAWSTVKSILVAISFCN